MPEMLLINPRKRRAAGSKKRRARPRRRNPINNIRSAVARRTAGRVMNPRRRRRSSAVGRRRRNPIRLGGAARTAMGQLLQAVIGAGGAIAVDVAYAKAAAFLPPTLQVVRGAPGIGDGLKAVITYVAGRLLDKPTKGYASKAALGALTVQAHGIAMSMLPPAMQVSGIGYYSPARLVNGTNRVGPVRQGMNAYTPAGKTQLLNAYTPAGRTQLLNSSPRVREGMTIR